MREKIYGIMAFLPLILNMVAIVLLPSLSDIKGIYFPPAYWLHLFATLVGVMLTFVVMLLFLKNVCDKVFFTTGQKMFWGFLFFFLNILVYPIYWCKYIYRTEKPAKMTESEDIRIENENDKHEQTKSDLLRDYEETRVIAPYYYAKPKAFVSKKHSKKRKKTVDRNWLTVFLVVSLEMVVLYVIGLILCLLPVETGFRFFFVILFFMELVVGLMITWSGVVCVATVMFIVDACEQERFSRFKKIVWCILFSVFSFFVFPIYWLLHIRKRNC